MKSEKTAAKDNELEIVEIAEFKRSDTRKRILKREEQERKKREKFYGILALFAVGVLAVILIGMFALRLSVVPLCIVLVLETVMAACLYEVKEWIHILEIAVGIGAGILFGRLSLMIVGTVVYLGAVLVLCAMKRLKQTG